MRRRTSIKNALLVVTFGHDQLREAAIVIVRAELSRTTRCCTSCRVSELLTHLVVCMAVLVDTIEK